MSGSPRLLLIYSALFYRTSGDTWGAGGGGEAIGATLVSTVPLPANPAQTQNVLANESKGLTQSQPKIEEKEPDAIEIQGKNAKIKPKKKQETASKEKPQPAPEEETNQVAFGEGGPVSGPYGTFSAGGRQGRIRNHRRRRGFRHEVRLVRARDSAESFGELAEVRGRSENHDARSACTSHLTWRATGIPTNVRVEQSSGVPSLDISAVRALQRIDTFGPLAAGLFRQQDFSGVLVRLQEVSLYGQLMYH